MRFSFRWFGPEDSIPLQYIRQIPCVTTVVSSCHNTPAGQLWQREEVAALSRQAAENGLNFSVVEGLPVHESIKLGLDSRDRFIENFITNLGLLADHGVDTVCYNFMPLFGWIRTDLNTRLEDGSFTVSFARSQLEAMNPAKTELKLPGWNFSSKKEELSQMLERYRAMGTEGMWKNLAYFLKAVVPEAERLGIRLAIHPDDPPLPLFGLPRIVSSLEDLLRITALVDSPANSITLCTGSLGSGSQNNVAEITDSMAARGRIAFVHARNVLLAENQDFLESAHFSPCGSLDMAQILSILYRHGFDGAIRSDHGRMVWGEQGKPGYGLYDRAMGICYLSGLWESLACQTCFQPSGCNNN